MPRYSGKKPFHQEIFTRHIGEIRSLLQALEIRDVFAEGENHPLMDMYENDDAIILEFDLPGFCLEDINLTQHGTTLILEAHRPRELAEGAARFICLERAYGRFHHAVNIPGNINQSAIKADYRLGVLRVTCPKTNDQKIPIKEILD